MEQNLKKLMTTQVVMKFPTLMERASELSWVRPSYFFKMNSVHNCITQELTPIQSFSTTISIICFTYSAYPYHHILNLITFSNTWWRLHIMNCFIIFCLHHTVSFSPVPYTEMPSNCIFPEDEIPSFTPIQSRWNYSFLYFNLCIFIYLL